jgi:cytochrome c oxidase subunit 2
MKIHHKIAFLATLGLILNGCAPSPTFLNPASLIAGHEAALYKDILFESILIFVLVIGALIWILIRDRSRGENKLLPPQIYGKMMFIVVPVLVIVFLDGVDFVWMAQTMRAVAAPAAVTQDINVHVIGHRWWWEYEYSDLGIRTANELHIPVGGTVQITLDSVDVIHSFWVPQLSGKIDVIPGQTNHMWITADQIGVFTGQCTEFCGTEHALMRLEVVVDTQADFDTWVANQQKPAPEPQTEDEKDGYKLVTTLCASCHSLNPAEAEFKTGPNLAHLLSRSTFAGATYELTEENIRLWLKDTQSMKPGNDMALKLTPQEIDHIMAYLKLLK